MIHEHTPCYHVWLESAEDKLARYGDCHATRYQAWAKLNRLRIVHGYDGRVMRDSDNRTMKEQANA